MIATIDLWYTREWFRFYKNHPEYEKQFKYIALLSQVSALPQLLAGYPNSHIDVDITYADYKKSGLLLPGISCEQTATWCSFFPVIIEACISNGINPDMIRTDKMSLAAVAWKSKKLLKYCSNNVSYIGAQNMYNQMIAAKVPQLTLDQAQGKANNCEYIVVGAMPIQRGGSGHVALLAPTIPNTTGNWIYQAGAKNGAFAIDTIFSGKNGVKDIRYFYIQ